MYEKLTLGKEKMTFLPKNKDEILLHTYVREIDLGEGKDDFFTQNKRFCSTYMYEKLTLEKEKMTFLPKNKDEILLHIYVRKLT